MPEQQLKTYQNPFINYTEIFTQVSINNYMSVILIIHVVRQYNKKNSNAKENNLQILVFQNFLLEGHLIETTQ